MTTARLCLLGIGLLLLSLVSVGCGSTNALPLHALEEMPAEVQHAHARTQQAYQVAAANPEVFQQLPCYCGCAQIAHKSLYDCYIEASAADGPLTYDLHAVGCGICVDITQDTVRLYESGQSLEQIHEYIDASYSRYGPSTGP